MSKNQEIQQDITKQMIQSLRDKSFEEWIKPFISLRLPINMQRKKELRGINIPILWYAAERKGFKHNLWATLKQVGDMKGKVNKKPEGCEDYGTGIIFFKFMENEEKDKSGKVIKKSSFPLYKHYTVFNVDQTDLDPDAIMGTFPKPAIEDAQNYIEAIDHKVTENDPSYSPTADEISMPENKYFKTSGDYYATYFRQLAAWATHKARLDITFEGSDYPVAMREMTTELAAAFLCGQLGVDGISQASRPSDYIAKWVHAMEKDFRVIFKVCSHAQKITDYLNKQAGIEL